MNRRDFLKIAAPTGAAVLLAGVIAWDHTKNTQKVISEESFATPYRTSTQPPAPTVTGTNRPSSPTDTPFPVLSVNTERLELVRSYGPLQYLSLQDAAGTVAQDSSDSHLAGKYLSNSEQEMLALLEGPFGGQVAKFSAANKSSVDLFSDSLSKAFNGAEGAAVVAVKIDPAALRDGQQHYFLHLRVSQEYSLILQKWSSDNQLRWRRVAAGQDQSLSFLTSTPLWFIMGLDWSDKGGYLRSYYNGEQKIDDGVISTSWSGSISSGLAGVGIGTEYFHSGGLAEIILFDHPIGPEAHKLLAGIHAERKLFVCYGDSKTAANQFQHITSGLLENKGERWDWRNIAVSGRTVSEARKTVDQELAEARYDTNFVLCNLGANDVTDSHWRQTSEESWKENYGYILDALHAKWPDAQLAVMFPWHRGFNERCDTLAAWINDLIGNRTSWCRPGPDERLFLQGSDDGSSYSRDGLHPNNAGYRLTGELWFKAIEG